MSVSNQQPVPCTDYPELCPGPAQPPAKWSRSQWEWNNNEQKPSADGGTDRPTALGTAGTDRAGVPVLGTDRPTALGTAATDRSSVPAKGVMEPRALTDEDKLGFLGPEEGAGSGGRVSATQLSVDKHSSGDRQSLVGTGTGTGPAMGNPPGGVTEPHWAPPLPAWETTGPGIPESESRHITNPGDTSVWNPYFLSEPPAACVPPGPPSGQRPAPPGTAEPAMRGSPQGEEGPSDRAAQQRKQMRRAMSECSHLSVPAGFEGGETYPDLPGAVSPPGPSPVPSPSLGRKPPMAQVKRSMTVAEDQPLEFSLDTNLASPRVEPAGASPVFQPRRLEQIPEQGGRKAAEGAVRDSVSPSARLPSPAPGGSEAPKLPADQSRGPPGSADANPQPGTHHPNQEQLSQPGNTSLSHQPSVKLDPAHTAHPERLSSAPTLPPSATISQGASSSPAKPIDLPANTELNTEKQQMISPERKSKVLPSASARPRVQPPASPKPPVATGHGKQPGSALASSTKRPSVATARSSTSTNKDTRPKVAEMKSPVKTGASRPLTVPLSKLAASPTSPPPRTAAPQKASNNSPPKRPTSIKTEPRSADTKKPQSAKSPSAEPSRPRTASSTPVKSSPGTPTARNPTARAPAHRAPRPSTIKMTAAAEAKRVAPVTRLPPKPVLAPRPPRPASAPTLNLKNVRSKIGSTENMKYQPGGGKARALDRKPEPSRLTGKPEVSAVTRVTKSATGREPARPSEGKVQIINKKVDYSHVQSKCGSKDNIKHVPGGGNIQIPSKKMNPSNASAKSGSRTNLKLKSGAGDEKVEANKLDMKNGDQNKVRSEDNMVKTPGGGTQVVGDELTASLAEAPPGGAAGSSTQNGVGEADTQPLSQPLPLPTY